MENLPLYIIVFFIATVGLAFCLFVYATKYKLSVAVVALAWLAVTGLLAWKGFFKNTSAIPPRLFLVMLPAIIGVVLVMITKPGRRFIDALHLKNLTILHIVRIPVELVLYWLAAQRTIPELMTFAGRNFDILSGITAPIIYLICFKGSLLINRKLLLAWNFICLGLLLNIVINAILAAPFPFQQFAFDQPNIAIFYFPFIWLPAFIVMAVLFSHLAAIRKLLKPNDHS
jgi:hypothetical protein